MKGPIGKFRMISSEGLGLRGGVQNNLLPLQKINNRGVPSAGVTAGTSEDFWHQTNGPTGGNVDAIAIDVDGRIFAGCLNTGLFRSTDGGNTWIQASIGGVNTIAINSSGYIFTSQNGVQRSTDHGTTWNQVNTGLTKMSVQSLTISPNGNIFAGTEEGGVFRSTNNGDNWMLVGAGLSTGYIYCVAANSNGDVFAGTADNGNVFRSTDNGANWVQQNTGLDYVYAFAFNSSGDIFAASGNRGVARSTDNGESWALVNTGLTETQVSSVVINSNGYIFAGTVGSGGVFRSTDNGVSWTRTVSGLANLRALSLAADLHGNIYAGTSGGIFISNNNGDHWSELPLKASDIVSLAMGSNGHVYAAVYGDGVAHSTDNGLSWIRENTGLTYGQLYVEAVGTDASGDIFAGSQSGITRSTNEGETWTQANIDLPLGQWPWIITFAAKSNGFLFAGGHVWANKYLGAIFRSSDNGIHWTLVYTDLSSRESIRSLAVNSSGDIFAGNDSGYVFRSTDDGMNWTTMRTGIKQWEYVNSIVFNARGDIFLGIGNYGIAKSTDNGSTWSQVNNGLTESFVWSLVLNSKGHFFAGTFGGVFRSTDEGMSWSPLASGMGNIMVPSLVSSPDGYIYAGTYGLGVFRGVQSRWQCQLKATAGSVVDNDNYLGVAPSGSDGFDSLYDVPEPPAPVGNYVQLYFPHPEYSLPTGDNLAQDIRADRAIGDTTVRWHFEVKTNFDSTVTIEAVPDGKLPTKIRTMLRDVTGGTRTFLRPGSMTYSYRSGVGTNVRKFEILIGDSLAPAALVLKPNGGEIIRSGKNYTLSYTAGDRSGIETTQIFYSLNSGTTYTNVATIAGNLSSYSWNAPSQYLNYQGSIKIIATDSMGNSSSDASDHVFTIVGDSLARPFTAGWTLMGLPLKPSDSTSAGVFGDDISQQFYMFGYTPSGGYMRSSVFAAGKGYWLGLLANCRLDVTGSPCTESLSVPLTKGWNIISDPLAVPIPKDSLVFRQSGTAKKYQDALSAGWIATGLQTYQPNSYISQDTLQLWNGYWLSVLQDDVSLVAMPPVVGVVPPQSRLEKTNVASPLDWQVSVVTSYATTRDQTLRFGVKPDGTIGFDPKYDEPKAPAPPVGKYVESYFNYPSWASVLGSRFNADIRNPNSTLSWNFFVAPSDSGAVNLTWTVPTTVPDSIQLQLVDGTTKIDMRKQSAYSFATRLSRSLMVNTTVTSVRDINQLPTIYALEQNYPNPFNPSTTIQYSLPYRSSVRLEIFNVLGQRVASLFDGEQEAGYQRLQWKAGASTGIYIYRLEAVSIDNPSDQFTQVKKMLLLK